MTSICQTILGAQGSDATAKTAVLPKPVGASVLQDTNPGGRPTTLCRRLPADVASSSTASPERGMTEWPVRCQVWGGRPQVVHGQLCGTTAAAAFPERAAGIGALAELLCHQQHSVHCLSWHAWWQVHRWVSDRPSRGRRCRCSFVFSQKRAVASSLMFRLARCSARRGRGQRGRKSTATTRAALGLCCGRRFERPTSKMWASRPAPRGAAPCWTPGLSLLPWSTRCAPARLRAKEISRSCGGPVAPASASSSEKPPAPHASAPMPACQQYEYD